MAVELMFDKWPGEVNEVIIGATKPEGGSRAKAVKIGGQRTLPFLFAESPVKNTPKIAFEVWDTTPLDWPQALNDAYGKVLSDPFAWAQKCVKEYKAEMLCLRLQSTHPESGNKSPEEAAEFVSQFLKNIDLPLIIIGSGDDTKDNLVMPAVSIAARGERCLLGSAVQDNYKTLAASVLADGHSIIAESPIDINIAKQLNILISDMGLPLERIVINPTIGALGYGLEYAYSIMERARLAGLAGDKTVASPFICFVGQESWKTKEAVIPQADMPGWGNELERGIAWEALTATALIQSGADILVMCHPKAIEEVNKYIIKLMPKG